MVSLNPTVPVTFVVLLVVLAAVVGPSHGAVLRSQSTASSKSSTASSSSADPPLTIHVVPHTHDDVGWLKTVDEYFYGSNTSIQNAGVQYILDTVIEALAENSDRKFTYVEIAFFKRWWDEQTDAKKAQVRELITRGQLEFINGGWCMHDEAAPHVLDMIDQMTLGHRFLLKEFGIRPSIGWQIDPFGHSSTNARIFAEMGFNAFYTARIDYADYNKRYDASDLETFWRPSPSLGNSTDIFFGVFIDHYCWPTTFCFECGDDPVRDDDRLFDRNVEERADFYVAIARDRAQHLKVPHVMFLMGCDFAYQNADQNFRNMDRLIRFINANPDRYNGVRVEYSNPRLYYEAVVRRSQPVTPWSLKTDDFFPYADNEHAYWTGYFTSRAALKGYIRERSAVYRATQTMLGSVQAGLGSGTPLSKQVDVAVELDRLAAMDDGMGVGQHHDAVAGTEKQHVASDYAKRLYIGTQACDQIITDVISAILVAGKSATPAPVLVFCPERNVSLCPATAALSVTAPGPNSVAIVAYNALVTLTSEFVRLPVPKIDGAVFTVTTDSGTPIEFDLLTNPETDNNTLVFPILVGPLSVSTFFLTATKSSPATPVIPADPWLASDKVDLVVATDSSRIIVAAATSRLTVIENRLAGVLAQVSHEYLYYRANPGDAASRQASGAYILRPTGDQRAYSLGTPTEVLVIRGSLVSEVHLIFTPTIRQILRLYRGRPLVEAETVIAAPLDVTDGWGREFITRFSTSVASARTFYTDSNGLEFLQRRIDYRPTWTLDVTEPVAGNYYPVNTAAYIRDSTAQFTVLVDRSEGVGAVADQTLEFLVQRRLLRDDGRGVGEALDETAFGGAIRVRHWLHLDHPATAMASVRSLMQHINQPVQLVFSPFQGDRSTFVAAYETSWTPGLAPLPANVRLITLQVIPTAERPLYGGAELLVRLQHQFAVDEDATFSQSVTVELSSLLPRISAVTELTLSGNQDVRRRFAEQLVWTPSGARARDDVDEAVDRVERVAGPKFSVELKAMEIRTFAVSLSS